MPGPVRGKGDISGFFKKYMLATRTGHADFPFSLGCAHLLFAVRAFEKPVGLARAGVLGAVGKPVFHRMPKCQEFLVFLPAVLRIAREHPEQTPPQERQCGKLQRPEARDPCHQDQDHIEQQQREGKLVEAIAAGHKPA